MQLTANDSLRATRDAASKEDLSVNGKSDPRAKIAKKRYRGDKAPIKIEDNPRDNLILTVEGYTIDEWIRRRSRGTIGGWYLPEDDPEIIIHVSSSFEEEDNEESEEDPEEDFNPSDDDTTPQ